MPQLSLFRTGITPFLVIYLEKNEKPIKPTLILCVDILELAFSTTNEAIMVFERFLELIMPKGRELFSSIIYIPSNHDHHLNDKILVFLFSI